MNTKISVFVIRVKVIISLLLHNKHDCTFNVGVPQGSIIDPTLFLPYVNYLPDDVICNISIYAGRYYSLL